jgi:chromosome partitioning protein
MARKLAFVMQKGGVGKTSVSVNVAAAMAAHLGLRVMVVDFDGQRNATFALIGESDAEGPTIAEVIRGQASFEEARLATPHHERLTVVPGSRKLAAWEKQVTEDMYENLVLATPGIMERSAPADVDVIIYDTPPSLGLWLQVALAAADGVVIVGECERLCMEGLKDVWDTLSHVREVINPALTVDGIVLNKVRDFTRLHKAAIEEYRDTFGADIIEPLIPVRTSIGEASAYATPIEFYTDRSAAEVREMFREIAGEIASRGGLTPVASAPPGRRSAPLAAASAAESPMAIAGGVA